MGFSHYDSDTLLLHLEREESFHVFQPGKRRCFQERRRFTRVFVRLNKKVSGATFVQQWDMDNINDNKA